MSSGHHAVGAGNRPVEGRPEHPRGVRQFVALERSEQLGAGAATMLLAALLGVWTMLTPAYRGPDEPQHVSTVLRLATGGGYPAPGDAYMDPAVLSSYRWVDYWGRQGRVPKTERPARLAHPPSMRSLRAPDAPRPPTGIDQMTQHPPGYYALLAGVVKVFGLEGASPTSVILVLRLFSAALLLPVPLLCLLVARRLGLPPPLRVVSAFFPAAWLQFTHIGAVVNNGTLLVLAFSVAVSLLIPIAQGDTRAGRAVAAGAAVSVALLTKGLALGLVATLAVAYVGAVRRAGGRAAGRSFAVAALATLPGLAWWVANIVRFGKLQPSPYPLGARTEDISSLPTWAQGFADTFSWTLWWALGWAETRVPSDLAVTATALLVILVLAGSWLLRRYPVELLVLHSTWVGPLAIVAYGSLGEYLRSGDVRAAQGRYVQTAVVAFAVLVVAVLCRIRRPLPLVPAASLLVGGVGIVFGYRHFWTGSGGSSRWDALTSWWPDTTGLLLVSGLAAMASAVLGTAALARLTATDGESTRARHLAEAGAGTRP